MEGRGGILVQSGDIKAWEEKLSDLMESEIKRISRKEIFGDIKSFMI